MKRDELLAAFGVGVSEEGRQCIFMRGFGVGMLLAKELCEKGERFPDMGDGSEDDRLAVRFVMKLLKDHPELLDFYPTERELEIAAAREASTAPAPKGVQ